MTTCALLVRFDAQTGKEDPLEELLRSIQPPGGASVGLRRGFSLRIAREIYGFFGTFDQDSDREAFLAALAQRTDGTSELLARPPIIEKIAILSQSGVPPAPVATTTSSHAGNSSTDKEIHSHVQEIAKIGSRDAPGG
jgi:hypothetical protein